MPEHSLQDQHSELGNIDGLHLWPCWKYPLIST